MRQDDADDWAESLRSVLSTTDVPAPRVDLDQLLGDGRRARRRRRYTVGGLAAAATVLVLAGTVMATQALSTAPAGPPTTVAATSSTAVALPDCVSSMRLQPARREDFLKGSDVVADPTGHYLVVKSFAKDSFGTPMLWHDGRYQQPFAKVPPMLEPQAVNAHGRVVGTGQRNRRGDFYAWVFSNSRLTVLPAVPGYPSAIAHAVNERGDITGEAYDRAGRHAAVVWPAGDPDAVRILATDAVALGIGDDGTVIGSLGDGSQPYVWDPQGNGRALADSGQTSGGLVTAMAIRGTWALGWIVVDTGRATSSIPGPVSLPPANTRVPWLPPDIAKMIQRFGAKGPISMPGLRLTPVRWNLLSGEVSAWPELDRLPTAINAEGWLTLPAIPGRSAAVLTGEGQIQQLRDGDAAYPVSISDDGRRILGLIGEKVIGVWSC